MHIPTDLLIPMISAGAALIGAFIGAIINPYITSRLRASDRQLELYKIRYPQMVETAQKLMDKAEAVLSDISSLEYSYSLFLGPFPKKANSIFDYESIGEDYETDHVPNTIEEIKRNSEMRFKRKCEVMEEKIGLACDELYSLSIATEWLLGSNVREAVGGFKRDCFGTVSRIINRFGDPLDYNASFLQINAEIQNQLRLPTVERQFRHKQARLNETNRYSSKAWGGLFILLIMGR